MRELTENKKDFLQKLGSRWALLFLVIEVVFFSAVAPGFLRINTIQIIFFFGTAVFLMGTAELFVIITGGIDLSVGYVMGFASIVSAKLIAWISQTGIDPVLSIIAGVCLTLLIGLIPGYINGVIISRLHVPPFIATFSMLGISHGLSELIVQDHAAKNLPYLASAIGNGYFVYIVPGKTVSFFTRPEVARGVKVISLIPNIVVISFAVIAVFAFILKRTKFGQHTYAIGGNEDAAIRSGINIKRHITKIYMLSSFLASLAGVIYTLKYITGKADAGAASLLDSIAAVVIGGASLYGGKGTVWRTILGGTIIAVLDTGLRVMGIPTFDKYIIVGIILIFAVLIDQIFPEVTYKEKSDGIPD